MSSYSGVRRARAAQDARAEAAKRYNTAVLNELNAIDKDAALTLNQRGTAFGLWDTVAYCHANGHTPLDAAVAIAKQLES